MKVLVTGLNGTLGPVLADAIAARGDAAVGWDRARVPPDDEAACRRYLDTVAPTAVCHLAMGGEDWAALLAGWCRAHDVPFLFTSTAMVFDHEPDGPHRVDDERTARDDYGRYKIRCEDAIADASDAAIVARIGWQIGDTRGGNNMLEALHRRSTEAGVIAASSTWTPACSFMRDTAAALAGLLVAREPGTYHLDSNALDALDFPAVVRGLDRLHSAGWAVEVNRDYRHDQRLLDPRVGMPSLAARLGLD